MKRGDMDEMSFAFAAVRDEFNDDYSERNIKEKLPLIVFFDIIF